MKFVNCAQSFQELIEMANKGNRQMVDLTVKDTAGMDYNMALCDTLVSSFGKVAKLRSKCPGTLHKHSNSNNHIIIWSIQWRNSLFKFENYKILNFIVRIFRIFPLFVSKFGGMFPVSL